VSHLHCSLPADPGLFDGCGAWSVSYWAKLLCPLDRQVSRAKQRALNQARSKQRHPPPPPREKVARVLATICDPPMELMNAMPESARKDVGHHTAYSNRSEADFVMPSSIRIGTSRRFCYRRLRRATTEAEAVRRRSSVHMRPIAPCARSRRKMPNTVASGSEFFALRSMSSGVGAAKRLSQSFHQVEI